MRESPSTTGVKCVECGVELSYCGMGRRPRYCSQTCRSRAYEARRAARAGVVATRVVERVVEADAHLDVDTVVRWLDGHPRRLSAVLRGIEWTGEQKDGLRYGLERADMDQVVVSREQRHDLLVMQLLDEQRRQEISSLQREVEALTRVNEKLVRQLREVKSLPETPSPALSGGPSRAVPETGYKTTSVGGKDFRVPAHWTRQQARQWCREHPEQGTTSKQ